MNQTEYDRRVGASSSRALIRRLETLSSSASRELLALDDAVRSTHWLEPGESIISEGDTPNIVFPILEGLAYRYTELRSGRRQITALLVPGDISGGYDRLAHPVHYSVRTLTRARVATIDADAFWDLFEQNPVVAAALNSAALVDENVLRAWIVNLGQRQAKERMAHLFCELEHRMRGCGLMLAHGEFELPLTQEELGSALGLTSVHVNRVLQSLRAEKLIAFRNRIVRIDDLGRLRAVAGFDPAYLEVKGAVRERFASPSRSGVERHL